MVMWVVIMRTCVADTFGNYNTHNIMAGLKRYERPSFNVAEAALEGGFCVSISFGVGTQSYAAPESFGMDDMSESTDNAGW